MADKDQAQGAKPAEQSQEKPLSFDERFDKGWDQVELLTRQEAEAKVKVEKPDPAKEKEKLPEGGTPNSDRTPIKVLKVQGKDLPVYSVEELLELAQKGADYTKKTQALADDRRAAEQQLKEEEKRLKDAAFDLNKTLDELARMKAGTKPENATKDAKDNAIPEEEAKIYSEYGIDPKYAQPHEIKIVRDLAEVKGLIREIQSERVDAEVRKIISKEREAYPYEDVVDDQGQNITEAQLASIVTAKKKAALEAKETPDYKRWIKEGVQEIHLAQKKLKETLTPQITEDMDADVFLTRFPSLADKVKEKLAAQASLKKAEIPPSLPSTKRPVVMPSTQKAVHPAGKSMMDYLDAGFNDPETIKALSGE